jgi:hypothetical protein
MNQRERLLKILNWEIPDCVPVCPDISNMIPARLTGKPFWDIYLYQDPPLWKAYIDAVKYFDIDGGFELYEFGDLFEDEEQKCEKRIVFKDENRIFFFAVHPDPLFFNLLIFSGKWPYLPLKE